MTRCGWILIVVFLVTGCGKFGPGDAPWPAKVVSYQGFDSEQQTLLLDALKDFNSQLGKDVVSISPSTQNAVDSTSSEDTFYVTIARVPFNEKNKNRLGFTRGYNDHCEIEISEPLFLPAKLDMFKPVVWHELGHCVGFDHDGKPGEIMSTTAAPMTSYSEEALTRFFKLFLEAARLG